MTVKSYHMSLQAFGLRLSFKDARFKSQLTDIKESELALKNVEERLKKKIV